MFENKVSNAQLRHRYLYFDLSKFKEYRMKE